MLLFKQNIDFKSLLWSHKTFSFVVLKKIAQTKCVTNAAKHVFWQCLVRMERDFDLFLDNLT